MAEHSGASYSQLWFKMGVPLRNNFQENFISEDPWESLGNQSQYNAIFCGSYPHYMQTALKSFGQLFVHLGLKYYFSNILSIVIRLEFQRLYENLLQYILLFLAMPQKKYHKKLIFFSYSFFSFFDKLSIIEQAELILVMCCTQKRQARAEPELNSNTSLTQA